MFDLKIIKEKLLFTLGSMVTTLALVVTTMNVNTTCVFIAHQAKLPDSAKKLRKI